MCRILLVSDTKGLNPDYFLDHFKQISQNSEEYQGHGWGCAWLDEKDEWQFHHNIKPVWEEEKLNFPETRLFIAHARSAFRDEGIEVKNNMPFTDGTNVFAFNGELRGVRINSEGRIGAEKIFNYIRRFYKGDMHSATQKGVEIINKRTRYIRAMNFFLADKNEVQVCSWFGEQPEYFQLQLCQEEDTLIVCSRRFEEQTFSWKSIPNFSINSYQIRGTAA